MKTTLRKAILAGLVAVSIASAAASADRIDAPPTNGVASLAISPDGRTLAVVSRHQGRNHLWLQPIGPGQARALPGTEEAEFPFWSPDGRHVGYFASNELRRIDVATGAIRTVTSGIGWPAGGSWAPDGTILFAAHGSYTLSSVDENGGAVKPLSGFSGSDLYAHVHPQFLSDGNRFLFYVQGEPAVRGIHIGRLDSPDTYRLVDSEAAGAHAAGKLYFLHNGALHARTLDTGTMTLGTAVEILAAQVPVGGRSVAALSAAGDHVAWRAGLAGSQRQLTWYDRIGNTLGTVGDPFIAGAGALSISPDGRKAVINFLVEGMGEIGVVDLESGARTTVTQHPANDSYPIWSDNSTEVIFSSKRTPTYEMYRQVPGANTGAQKVFTTIGLRHAMDMSHDGRYLIYRMNSPDLWALDQRTQREISIIPRGRISPQWPQFSPDARWIAFQSGSTGRKQVHLQGPFAPPSVGKTSDPLTIDGGGWVRWRGDGRELFYAAPDGTLMAIGLTFAANAKRFTAASPVRLFTPPMTSGPENSGLAQQYAVSADGQRFLVIAAPEAASPVYVLGAPAANSAAAGR